MEKNLRPAMEFIKRTFGDKKLIGVEVGACQGEHAIVLYQSLNFEKLYLIDIWDNYSQEGQNINYLDVSYQVTKKRFKNYNNVIIVRNDSVEVAKTFEDNSLDFVYIDANHQYEYVKADIEAWYPKVKKEAYLMGHDYDDIHWLGVKKAVDEFIATLDCKLLNGVYKIETLKELRGLGDWWIQK